MVQCVTGNKRDHKKAKEGEEQYEEDKKKEGEEKS